ncbi:MAG: non-homologous end-joining DNA ligase [Nocardioidaceae bacterium]
MAENEVRVEVGGRTLTLSNLDKVLYPNTGTTKGEVLDYYARISPVLLPHLHARAVTRVRWPGGTGEASFFEKNLPAGAPKWLPYVEIATTGSRGGTAGMLRYPVVEDLAALTYLVNLASLELHVHQWLVRDGQVDNPDRMVIDLDPGAPADLHECAQVALLVRDRLADMGLACAPVTSGSKGMHLYAPLPGRMTPDEVREVAHQLALSLEQDSPLVVSRMTRSLRPGKVFLDWSQNTGAKTTITPYSLRGTLTPYAAAPRTWDEIEEGAGTRHTLGQLRFDEVLNRAESTGDIYGDLLTSSE